MAEKDGYLDYSTFAKIYRADQKAFKFFQGSSRDSGTRYYNSKSGKVNYNDYDAFVDRYTKNETIKNDAIKKQEADKAASDKAAQDAANQAAADNQARAQATAQQEQASRAQNEQAQRDAELARLQQQLSASQAAPQAAGVPTPTPIEQVAQQYQTQIQDYQKQLTDSQNTLFTQLASQQAEQQKKATDMFAGYQQYTDQLRGDWQAGLQQTRDLIGGLSSSYNQQIQGLQGIFNQSLEESRVARETETQERGRIQGLLEQQAAQAVESRNNQQRFQESAQLVASKKSQDLTRSFNRASSQAQFGVLSNQRRRGGASQTIFSDEGTTSQNPYGYSNIFFS